MLELLYTHWKLLTWRKWHMQKPGTRACFAACVVLDKHQSTPDRSGYKGVQGDPFIWNPSPGYHYKRWLMFFSNGNDFEDPECI